MSLCVCEDDWDDFSQKTQYATVLAKSEKNLFIMLSIVDITTVK